MSVLIGGGGIGGLTLALSLHERGIPCVVLEAATEVRPLGVGINTLPHAIRELAALGLLPALDACAIRTRELRYLNRFGQSIWVEPRGLHAGYDLPQLSIHRGWLQTLLWNTVRERLGESKLMAGARLTGFSQGPDSVTVHCADGRTVSGSALIGADGIHSLIRRTLHPDDGALRWNGIQMWRGAMDWPIYEGGDVMVIAGDMTEKLVLYPIAAGIRPETRLTNWAVCVRQGDGSNAPPRREDWSRPGRLDEVLPHVRRFDLPMVDVEALVRATPEFFEYPMCDRDPLPWWTQGRVTLLGDAAHPMYPVGSNGASQAILDARCLAALLSSSTVPDALVAYEAERRPKTAAIVAINRRGGPERVVDVVSERAPDGFARLEDVITHEELAAIASGYATMAGFSLGSTSPSVPG
jgi:2-polyprenyl-6-methoxyphenol hydroxylase-like FAD-dependent oxidoreductase